MSNGLDFPLDLEGLGRALIRDVVSEELRNLRRPVTADGDPAEDSASYFSTHSLYDDIPAAILENATKQVVKRVTDESLHGVSSQQSGGGQSSRGGMDGIADSSVKSEPRVITEDMFDDDPTMKSAHLKDIYQPHHDARSMSTEPEGRSVPRTPATQRDGLKDGEGGEGGAGGEGMAPSISVTGADGSAEGKDGEGGPDDGGEGGEGQKDGDKDPESGSRQGTPHGDKSPGKTSDLKKSSISKQPATSKSSAKLGAKGKAKGKAKSKMAVPDGEEGPRRRPSQKSSSPRPGGDDKNRLSISAGKDDEKEGGDSARSPSRQSGDGDGKGGGADHVEGEGGEINLDKLKETIRLVVREVFKDEVTVESKNEKQLLDILRLRDNEVIRAHEKVAEVTGLLIAADKTLDAMKAQVKEIEREKEELQNKMVQARVTEQKANTIVDANTKRSNDLSRDLEAEKKRRAEERTRLQGEIAQAKEDHRVEVMAYRRALSTEEAKVVMLQKELKDLKERVADLQRQAQAGPIPMVSQSYGQLTNSPSDGKVNKKGQQKKKIKSIENIYSPLSATGSLPKINKHFHLV